ncbi:MAG: Rz-like lysis system protein LysB [Ewingella sp.]
MKVILIVLLAMLACSLAGLRWGYNQLTQANQDVALLNTALTANAQALEELRTSGQRNERAQVVLRQQLAEAGTLAARRHQTITRLLNESETLRRWYQSALPDDVARLHARPEFATPDGYLRWLSEGQQLPDTGQPAEN